MRARGVDLLTDETVDLSCQAYFVGTALNGNLFLTSQRLIWVAHKFMNVPWYRPRKFSIELSQIQRCYHAGGLSRLSPVLVVVVADEEYVFRLFKGVGPLPGWIGLTKRWVEAINKARGESKPETGMPTRTAYDVPPSAAVSGARTTRLRLAVLVFLVFAAVAAMWIAGFALLGMSIVYYAVTGLIQAIGLVFVLRIVFFGSTIEPAS